MAAQAGIADSGVTRGAARCAAARMDPTSYADGGWQGFEFITTLSGCLASWVATKNADDLATAIKYWNVLLDDYQKVGDGQGGDTVVTHDTGYAMRTFAPFSALAYDWLHDAPGVTESLRAHARARFDAWMSYYSANGYLRDLPGANYQAGYTFAATLIAIAEGGEAGASGDAHWATVRDAIWTADLASALAPGGVLEGGDWAEGWQYGPLSVLEHALAARAMQENGALIPGAEAWASSLPVRFAYGLTPVTQKSFAGGDSDNTSPNRDPDNGALLAGIVGPSSEQAKTWARKLNLDLKLHNENPLFDALATAEAGPNAALPVSAPTNYLAHGVGNWYVRGAWSAETAWTVFQCSRRLVPDHEYNNAGNWVLTRGPDDLVVDPSPYGSVSTLTGNAPAVDSAAMPSGYSPSQGYWGKNTALAWARQSGSGVAAARCDYGDQFRGSDTASDVPHATRDFVLVPGGAGGTVVLIDRVVTGAAERGLHLRIRTPSALALSGDRASATLGSSALTISRLWSTSGAPSVRTMPQASECPSSSHTCDVSRLPSGTEYQMDVAGPSALAINVVSAEPSSAPAEPAQSFAGSGYRGALVKQGPLTAAVITNDAADAAPGSTLSYAVPAVDGAVHVVVDAPVDSQGKSDVTSVLVGKNCQVVVTPHVATKAGFEGRPLVLRMSANCELADDGAVVSTGPASQSGLVASSAGTGVGGAPSADSGALGERDTPNQGPVYANGGTISTGCAMRAPARRSELPVLLLASALGVALFGRRRRAEQARAAQRRSGAPRSTMMV